MKRFTLLLSFLFITAVGFSQSFNLYFENNDTVAVGDIGEHVNFYGKIVNTTMAQITTRWEIHSTNFPDNSWQFYVCDDINCWAPGFATRTQNTAANDTSLYKVTLIAGTSGVGSVVASVRDENDSTMTQEFLLTLDGTTSTNELASVVVFTQNAPNPFHDFTLVNYDLKGNEGRLIITDVAGRQINDYQLNADGQIRIGDDLNTGIYFYSLLVDGRVVTTKRLQKL